MKKGFIYKIEDYCFMEANEATEYSRFQLWICRVFKITPEKLFNYKMRVILDNTDSICLGDILRSHDGHNWLCMYKDGNQIYLVNINPCVISGMSGYMSLIGRTHVG